MSGWTLAGQLIFPCGAEQRCYICQLLNPNFLTTRLLSYSVCCFGTLTSVSKSISQLIAAPNSITHRHAYIYITSCILQSIVTCQEIADFPVIRHRYIWTGNPISGAIYCIPTRNCGEKIKTMHAICRSIEPHTGCLFSRAGGFDRDGASGEYIKPCQGLHR